MTKEELKKEAEELIQRFEMANSMNCFMQLAPDRKQIGEMLVMITEPREKRIAELEKENAELKETCNKWFEQLKNREEELLNELNNQNAKYESQIEEFEKENAELKAGRPEWHKVADGDLPKEEDLEMQVLCFTYDGYQLLSLFSDPKPIFKGYGVIAWCELPKYTEE